MKNYQKKLLILIIMHLNYRKVIQQNQNLCHMSKEESEVAFIPDNISNISSGKERFNEENTHKLEDFSISKVTKIQNNNFDPDSGLQLHELKLATEQKMKYQEQPSKYSQIKSIDGKGTFGIRQESFNLQNEQKYIQKKSAAIKYGKYSLNPYSMSIQSKAHSFHDVDNTYLQGKHTQTEIISEKQSFIEEEQDNHINQTKQQYKGNHKITKDLMRNKRKSEINFKQSNQTYPQTENQTFNVIEVNKYDQFETETGWLEHCVQANCKFLFQQTNTLISYNKALMIDIEKVQLRVKIIQLQIETNRLKIALRKSHSTKHINFSIDFKLNRSPFVRIPKKIDADLRTYCQKIQQNVNQMKSQYLQNAKTLSFLEVYENQFKKKVNFAYIYQEYLLEQGNRIFAKNSKSYQNQIKNSAPLSKKHFHQSKTKNTINQQKTSLKKLKKIVSGAQSSQTIQCQGLLSESDQSYTSLAYQLKINNSLNNKKLINIKSSSIQRFLSPQTSKKVSLTHHREINQHLNNKVADLQKFKQDGEQYALFNSSNRTKKHFYYECQTYLKQLQKDYLFECESRKRNFLLNSQNGFRQRELLRMKILQMKNQVLDTEVDIVTRQKQLKNENYLLKTELKLLEKQLTARYTTQPSNKTFFNKKEIASPTKSKKSHFDNYDLLYKQAEKRLKSFKSVNMLQNISKKYTLTSSQKIKSSKSIQGRDFIEKEVLINNHTFNIMSKEKKEKEKQNSEEKNLKGSMLKLKHFHSKQNKFLNRFKTSISDYRENINMTLKDKLKQSTSGMNPQKIVISEKISQIQNFEMFQKQQVEAQYYVV